MEQNNLTPDQIPVAKDIEQAVVGICLIDSAAMAEAGGIITPKVFYYNANRIIFQTLLTLSTEGVEPDLLTVNERLKKEGKLNEIGGESYLQKLTMNPSGGTHIGYWCALLIDKYIGRQSLDVSRDIQNAIAEGKDYKEVRDTAILELMKIDDEIESLKDQGLQSVAEQQLDEIWQYMEGEKSPFGLKTGLSDLDKTTNGLPVGLNFIGARPSMGKTSLMLQLINFIGVDQKEPTALFSLEMPNIQILRWLESQRSGIKNEDIQRGNLSRKQYQQLENTASKITNSPIFADDTPGINIAQVRSKCIKTKKKHGLSAVFIDYLQLMGVVQKEKGKTREREVAEISWGLKILQRELNVPIIVLTQLNRASEKDGNKQPGLNNLRESGALEQDADFVMFLHRPERYGIEEFQDGDSTKGVTQLIIAKNRDGKLENIRVRFDENTVSFKDYDNDTWVDQYADLPESNEFEEESPF